MVKYLGPKIKVIRRLGLLPGLSLKNIKNRKKTPGQHGKILHAKASRSSLSDDYKNCLMEKQKLRFNYGITEKQLLSYYTLAKKTKGSTGALLLELLESRLDSIVYRLGFAPTIPFARQLINHGHIFVNNECVTIPSFRCRTGDKISVGQTLRSKQLVMTNLQTQEQKRKVVVQRMKHSNLLNSRFDHLLPTHLTLDVDRLIGTVLAAAKRSDILFRINELKVLEYYSR